MKYLVGRTLGSVPVYVDLASPHAVESVARTPHLLSLAQEALERSTISGPQVNLEYDMGRPIGYTSVVQTGDDATVFYARLMRDTTYTRFTKAGKPAATTHITLLLELDKSGTAYDLRDVWLGQYRPPRPGGSKETADSAAYWQCHAVIFQNHPLQSNTVTRTCPY